MAKRMAAFKVQFDCEVGSGGSAQNHIEIT